MSRPTDPNAFGEVRPTLSERKFGLILATAAGVWALGPLLFARPMRPTLGWVALALFVLAAVAPQLLKGPRAVWEAVMSRVLEVVGFLSLAVAYFFVVTPIAIAFRFARRDALRRRFDSRLESYWVRRGGANSLPSDMQRQF